MIVKRSDRLTSTRRVVSLGSAEVALKLRARAGFGQIGEDEAHLDDTYSVGIASHLHNHDNWL